MDNLIFEAWKENFRKKAAFLQIELNSFFKEKNIEQYYQLEPGEDGEALSLKIIDKSLPTEISDQLTKLFMDTQPEDSI